MNLNSYEFSYGRTLTSSAATKKNGRASSVEAARPFEVLSFSLLGVELGQLLEDQRLGDRVAGQADAEAMVAFHAAQHDHAVHGRVTGGHLIERLEDHEAVLGDVVLRPV